MRRERERRGRKERAESIRLRGVSSRQLTPLDSSSALTVNTVEKEEDSRSIDRRIAGEQHFLAAEPLGARLGWNIDEVRALKGTASHNKLG